MEKHEATVMKVMSALPHDPKKLTKSASNIANMELENDEILAMVDCGSFRHAIDAKLIFLAIHGGARKSG